MAIYGTTFVVNWLIFSHFGMLFQEKSGNPECNENSEKHELDNQNQNKAWSYLPTL
jgi:hypothetical protein